jgi:Protein of unknown function (DUF2958)
VRLLTKDLEAKLPKLYATDGVPLHEKVAIAKFFFPSGRGTWFVFEGELDPDCGIEFFGYVVSPLGPDCDEVGYFTLGDLESVNLAGLKVERDIWFKPTKMRDLKGEAYSYTPPENDREVSGDQLL